MFVFDNVFFTLFNYLSNVGIKLIGILLLLNGIFIKNKSEKIIILFIATLISICFAIYESKRISKQENTGFFKMNTYEEFNNPISYIIMKLSFGVSTIASIILLELHLKKYRLIVTEKSFTKKEYAFVAIFSLVLAFIAGLFNTNDKRKNAFLLLVKGEAELLNGIFFTKLYYSVIIKYKFYKSFIKEKYPVIEDASILILPLAFIIICYMLVYKLERDKKKLASHYMDFLSSVLLNSGLIIIVFNKINFQADITSAITIIILGLILQYNKMTY